MNFSFRSFPIVHLYILTNFCNKSFSNFFLYTLNHAVKLSSVCCPRNDIKLCLEG